MLRSPVFPLALVLFTATACQDGGPSSPSSASGSIADSGAPLASLRATRGAVDDRITGHYIVTFKAGVNDVPALARRAVADAAGTLLFTYTNVIHGFAAAIPDQALDGLRHNPQVELVEQDARVTEAGGSESTAPWGLDRVDQRSLPLDRTYSYEPTGAGVNVYVFDTGIRQTHVDFGGRADGVYTAFNDSYGTSDCKGHGTHVAGTIGGTRFGVAKDVRIHSVRVLDCTGYGSWSGMIAALDWVVRNGARPAVINMSISGSVSSSLNSAIQAATTAGIVVVVAAGNNSADACNYSPANAPSAITVAASTSTDAQASYSDFGRCVDVYAPGTAITSTVFTSDTSTGSMSGTSMATPHVAGAAALYLENHPGASVAEVAQAITSTATIGAITNPGSGSPNLLLYTRFGDTAPPPPADTTATPPPADTTAVPPPPSIDAAPKASFSVRCSGTTCSYDGNGSIDDKGIADFQWSFGDGSSASPGSAQMTHTYPVRGRYSVTLVVIDGSGQTGTASRTVNVKR